MMSIMIEPLPSPDTVPVVPADEGSEGASLTPVTVGAHQSIGTGPIPWCLSVKISKYWDEREWNSPSKLAPTHLPWPLEAHDVAACVSGFPVWTVQSPRLGGGSMLTTTGRQRITWTITVNRRAIVSHNSPLMIQTAMTSSIPMAAIIFALYPIFKSREGQFSLGIKHGTRHESAWQHNLVSPLVLT